MKITLVLDIPKIKSVKTAQDYATCLAEHLIDTFNDDNSIKSVLTSVPKERPS
jgi:hypothetical protein